MNFGALWLTTVLCLPLLSRAAAPDNEPLLIMLQGDSVQELRELVERAGGSVTHNLPIINALGASVTAQQLEQIRSSPVISRLIDDLSMDMSEPLPPPDATACALGGALEAQLASNTLEWAIHNLGEATDRLKSVKLSWPSGLGSELHAQLGEATLELSPATLDGEDRWQTTTDLAEAEAGPQPGTRTQFSITFPANTSDLRDQWQQSDFQITLQFGTSCTLTLIPGYADYLSDTYYPRVSGAADLHRHGITGRGVTVAVLDSGLWEHPALATDTEGEPRIIGRYDAIDNRASVPVPDASGHGTHMSSVIANSERVLTHGQPDGSYKGIAPDAQLVAIKAFDEEGQGDFLDIVRGIQWVVEHREQLNIRVLNLSFAARPRWPYFLDPINQALMHAWAAGITVVAAAGNEGPEPMTIGSPGNLPYIITVGAYTDSWTVDDRNDDYIPGFSSRGPTPSGHIKPDLVAPGGHIAGLASPGSTLTRKHPNYMISSGELVMTGTSQASALVSGIAALLLQMEPELTPDDVKCKLMSSAEPAIHKNGRLYYSPFLQGSGAVSATRAVTLGTSGCGNQGLDIARDIRGETHYEGPAIVGEAGDPTLPGLQDPLTPKPTEDAPSDALRWGVKAHIEREDAEPPSAELPVDWLEIYTAERSRIEALSRQDNGESSR